MRLSRLALRVLSERERDREIRLLEEVARDRQQFLLPLQFATQVLTVTLAVLITWLLVGEGLLYPLLWALLIMVSLVALFRQLLPRFLTQKDPERYLLTTLPLLSGFYRLISWLSAPIVFLLRTGQRMIGRQRSGAFEETSDEEIQAFIDVGEEDGIFEEQDSELIQSALEFGSTLVREIMTPRTAIVSIPDTATISELKELIDRSRHSRIPVYRDNLDQIVGVVYVRTLLSYLEENQGEKPITPLIKKPWFVPETKNVSELLREMQSNSEPMAIVISEYASVSGLVTIEDLLEEIVGEIYDEDEPQVVDLEAEGKGRYIVLGGLEIDVVEEALGIDLGEAEVNTISGLVVAHLGKVPEVGEQLHLDGLCVEVLEADKKKIGRMRINSVRISLASILL